MLIINSTAAMTRALDQPIDPDLKRLLALRRDQLLDDTGGEYDLADLALFVVVAAGDLTAAIESAAGYPVVTDAAFEWVARHGRWLEAPSILDDSGYGIVLFVPDDEGIDPTLLALLRDEAASTDVTEAAPDLRSQPTVP